MNKKLLFALLLLILFGIACYVMGSSSFGWVGVIAVMMVFVVICGVQFYRTFKLLATIQNAPEGRVHNALWLAQNIKPGMSLVKIVQRAGALGKKQSDAPEVFGWQDDKHRIDVTLAEQKVVDVQIHTL